MEQDKPLLEEATFKFTQDAHCLSEEEFEQIEISIKSSLGVDRDTPRNHFFTIKTNCWSLNSVDELQSLFARIEKILNTSSAPQKEDFMLK